MNKNEIQSIATNIFTDQLIRHEIIKLEIIKAINGYLTRKQENKLKKLINKLIELEGNDE